MIPLSPTDRARFIILYEDGLSNEQISKVMNMPYNQVTDWAKRLGVWEQRNIRKRIAEKNLTKL